MVIARDRDIVQAVRAELAAIDPPRACCRTAERDGLGSAARGRARTAVVARLAVRLAEGAGEEAATFDWEAARSHCRAAWLRGRFLASGSLTLGGRGAHLEFVVPIDQAGTLVTRLQEVGFRTASRERRRRGVVTSKRTETILGLLRFCGASASVLEIESRLVIRQLQGYLNRVLNAETANLERSVASSARQLGNIEQLQAEGRLADLPDVDRAVARERLEAPEASLTELATRLGLSRARVQRAFQRLEAKASIASGTGDLS